MIGARILTIPMLAAALLAAACDDSGDRDRAKQAAVALGDYYRDAWRPPGPAWTVLKVGIGKDNAVTVNATVTTELLTKKIMERSRFEQMEIARMACPAVDARVWARLGRKQQVGVALSGSLGHIATAQCKRP